jgi:prevent-host-death family protein
VRVAICELRAGLSRYIALARDGAVIEITTRGKPVARMIGVPDASKGGIARLLATGAAQCNGRKLALLDPVVLCGEGKPLSAIVMEDRG